MNEVDWMAYFRQNQRDRRGIAWYETGNVPEYMRLPLRHTLDWLRRVERRDGRRLRRWLNSAEVELLVAEKEQAATLLDRLVSRFGNEPFREGGHGVEFLTGPWSVAAVIARDAVLLRLYGALRSVVADPVVHTVADQVLYDKKFQIRFLCEWRGRVPWTVMRALGCWAVAGAWWRQRALLRAMGIPAVDFARGCWANLRAAEAAFFAGQTFTRGAAEQVPLVFGSWPRAHG